MTTRYTEPLGAAYRRMTSALFKPFNLEKWFVVGFASWIAGWTSGGGYNYSTRFPTGGKGSVPSTPEELIGSIFQETGRLWADPMWRAFIIGGALVIVVLAFVIAWINSRGEFVFLDAVVNGRSEIKEPWHAYAAQGNSLFLWRLVFGLIMLTGFAIMLAGVFVLALGGRIPRSFDEVPWMWVLVGFGAVWLPFVIVGAYVNLFLRHFVTLIMFRDRCTTTEAWRTFSPILRERFGSFVLYGLFLLVVYIGLFLALIPAILLTCCLLACLLVLPFIGAVVWLPVSYTSRGFGPEFLKQFGPAYSIWPPPAVAPETPPELPG